MKTMIAYLSALLLAIFLAPASSGAAVELRLNLRSGASYRVRSENFNRMVQSMVGVELEMSQRMVIYYTFTVRSASGQGEFTLDVNHEAVSVELNSLHGDMRWDSNQGVEPEHPLARGLAALVGESYTLRLNSAGEVLAVEGLDMITEKMAGDVELPEGDNREMVLGGLKELAGEEAQKEMLGQLFGVYPIHPVETGDSWAVVDTSGSGPWNRLGSLTLNGLKGNQATIGLDAEISTGKGGMQRSLGPIQVEMELTGAQTGSISLDLDTGWITRRQMRIDINGSYTLVDGPKLFSDKKMPVTMESIITWEPF
jgi:hypothetical protein